MTDMTKLQQDIHTLSQELKDINEHVLQLTKQSDVTKEAVQKLIDMMIQGQEQA